MDRATFERFGAFVAEFADAFHDSRAYRIIGEDKFYELRRELNELRRATEAALANERGRERVLTPLNARLLHECLNVAHVCMTTDKKVRDLIPAVFDAATVDACYVMQQVDNYLLHKRIDALGDRWMR